MNDLASPLLLYMGGKWRLAPWIIGHFPEHRAYVEPFGGSAAVLLRKDPARVEIYNDLDGDLVNLFKVLRSGDATELCRLVSLTPYARAEYDASFEPTLEPVERARRLLVRLQMGFGTNSTRLDRRVGFRGDGPRSRTAVAAHWARLPAVIEAVVDRLRGVLVENIPALELASHWNDPTALQFWDPPYLPSTRSTKCKSGEGYHTYSVEMTEADHVRLLEVAQTSKAMILISGYHSDLYDRMLVGWDRREKQARSQENRPRTEVLWINPAAAAAWRADHPLWRS